MNYELALKLKEAGFPQRHLHVKPGGCEHWGTKEYPVGDMTCGCWINYPTLEELIEACGQNILQLVQRSPTVNPFWEAYQGPVHGGHGVVGTGNTPTEAVAHLWLSLNSKA